MTTATEQILVFDTGPLSHIARQGWLGVLKALVGARQALIPDVVVAELRVGAARDSRIQAVLDAEWIEHRELRTSAELRLFAQFAAQLVVGDRNRGEAGVLALAKALDATAVIDDAVGRKAARDNEIALRPTLALLCDAIRDGLLTIRLVSAFVDDLLASNYRLPIKTIGGFEAWTRENAMFDLPAGADD